MNGAFLYDKKANKYIYIKNFKGLVIDIKEDSNKNIWFATQGDGLYIYHQTRKKWSHYNDKNKKLPAYINSICINSNGNVMIGTSSMLTERKTTSSNTYIYEFQTKQLTVLYKVTTVTGSLLPKG